MAALMAAGTGLGAKEVARWQYIRETFESELGIGLAAAVSAVTVAITSLTLGKVIDRRDPRPFVLLAFALAAIGNLLMGVVLLGGEAPEWLILLTAAFDGAGLGIGGVSLLKTQAAFVQPGAEGAAEILNILRLGLGGVLGAILAGMSPDPAFTLITMTIALVVTIVFLWWVMKPIKPRTASPRLTSSGLTLVQYLRSHPLMARLVAIDLVLAFVIPTQLVNLVLFNLDAPEVASLSIAAGMIGVLLGRLALTLAGFRGNLRALLLTSVLGLAVLQLLGALALTNGWLLTQLLALPAIIIAGSVGSTYAQGLTAAMTQQLVAEDHRGALSSILVAGRNVFIAVAATLGALIADSLGSQLLLVALAGALVVVAALSRGFASLQR